MSYEDKYADICSRGATLSNFHLWLVVGEWTATGNDCAKYLNGSLFLIQTTIYVLILRCRSWCRIQIRWKLPRFTWCRKLQGSYRSCIVVLQELQDIPEEVLGGPDRYLREG